MANMTPFTLCYESWKEENKNSLNPLTYQRYTNIAEKHLLPYFTCTRMCEITDAGIRKFIELKQSEGLSSATISMIVLILKKILKKAGIKPSEFGLEQAVHIKNDRKNASIMEREDRRTLEEALSSEYSRPYIGILLALKMGLQVGEVCGLQWQDINFDKGTLHVCNSVQRVLNPEEKEGKTKLMLVPLYGVAADREIPIPALVKDYLEEFREDNGFVLKTKENKLPDPRTEQFRLNRLFKKLEIKEYNFNELRNTFAVKCLEAGMNMEDLSQILGHSSVAVTAGRYQSFLENKVDDRESLKRFMETDL